MRYTLIAFGISISLLFTACIGDDVIFDTVAESVRIINPVDSLGLGDTTIFMASYFNNVGMEETATFIWSSSDPSVLSVDANGRAIGLSEGNVVVSAEVALVDKDNVLDSFDLVVTQDEVVGTMTRTGTIRTTTSYVLEGSMSLTQTSDKLILEISEDWRASAGLPGLYVYLTNNPNSVNEAYEIGPVEVFSGAHSYEIDLTVGLNTYSHVFYYCKPFRVKVGDGAFDN